MPGYRRKSPTFRSSSISPSSASPARTLLDAARVGARDRREGDLRHLGRLRGDGRRRAAAPGRAARAGARARRAARRAELPRRRVERDAAERDVRSPRRCPPGRIAFSSQSGALGLALLEEADARGLGLSSFVSIGNKADVSSNDLLEYWQDDPNTDVVLLYLESFGNPRKFARVASRVARTKPILAMRSGTSRAGARAASSHTAALAGSDAAVEALFWQAGVLRARTLEELLDAAVFFSTQPLPRGNRVAVVTNAGGLGILCADACEAAGLSLPPLAPETVAALARVAPAEASSANPVDLLGSATAGDVRSGAPDRARRPGRRRRDRALRASGGRNGRRRGSRNRARDRRRREAGPARRDQRGRIARRQLYRTPSPRPGHSGSQLDERRGCVVPLRRRRISTASTRARPRRSSIAR